MGTLSSSSTSTIVPAELYNKGMPATGAGWRCRGLHAGSHPAVFVALAIRAAGVRHSGSALTPPRGMSAPFEQPHERPPSPSSHRRASRYLGAFGLGLVLVAGGLFWNFIAFIASSHGPCTDAGIRDAIQLFTAAGGLIAGLAAVAAAVGARWRRAAWAAGVEVLLLALWFVQVFAICPG